MDFQTICTDDHGVHNVASLVKKLIREVPGGLLTPSCLGKLAPIHIPPVVDAVNVEAHDSLREAWDECVAVLRELPPQNFVVFGM